MVLGGFWALKRRRLQATQRLAAGGLFDGLNVLGRGAAAAADNIDQAFGGKVVQQLAGHGWGFVKTCVAHGIGQASIGVAADKGIACDFAQFLNIKK
mgnify:CR=1 FL=1